MFIPQRARLEGVVGGDFDASFPIFADGAQKVPYEITESVEFEIDGLPKLIQGEGVTLITDPTTHVQNTVSVHYGSDQTGTIGEELTHFRLRFIGANPTDINYPIVGIVDFKEPR